MLTELRKAIASYERDIADFIEALVAVPTENPPGRHYRACAELIAGKLEQLGLEHRLLEVPQEQGEHASDRRYCVLGSHGAGVKTLYFHGHYDVVPATGEQQFRPSRQGTSLFGRGASDMKGGLASMIYAVQALKATGTPLAGAVALTIVPDEETGGARGSRYLAEEALLGTNGIGMFTAEPTSGVIWNASRGALSLLLTIRGRSAHVGLQHHGVNAFEQMVRVAGALMELKAEVEKRATAFKTMPAAARGSILMIGGRSEGGTNFNAVPAECRFTVDRRVNPEEDLATEKRRLFDLFDAMRRSGIDLDVEILQEGRPSGVPADNPVGRALASSVEHVTGTRPEFELCPGLLETRFYVEGGVPAFAYGPGILAVSHGPNEFVKLERVSDCAVVYALAAARLLGGEPA